MSLSPVYITGTSIFLPNNPVPSEEMEDYLGFINGKPSKSRKIVLRNNGIETRYYALKKGGEPTHTNAELAAEAIRGLFKDDPSGMTKIDVMTSGTSSPDQLMPSHGVMVHGCLPELGAIEVISPAGNCCAGMHALKYAYLSIRSGEAHRAVSSGSELMSLVMRSGVFEEEVQHLIDLHENPYVAFKKEFLRWMLSDGAGAFLLEDKPAATGLSLRLDWIDGVSYAGEMDTCMYQGGEKDEEGHFKGFKLYDSEGLIHESVFSVKQDIGLLSDNIVPLGGRKVKEIFERRGLTVDDVDWFLPHISSEFFKSKIFEVMEVLGRGIPYEKWFMNLSRLGNVGAASIYLMVHELLHSGKLKKGERLLLLVPESARFSYMFAMLTVV
ncbi:beta-ketoacyl-ACP synthase III [Dinghuibacter silviterrae]|uniref:3-oxoacyl-[acyl-carrier-protein] synthase-3 n=1 Tax=Dinghuibacter silviterrae TaxID=1539049 RepID=A0A4R8DSX2_9BACT|nr:beta-ketoacyl-ACP synthase III [Dinghuibacter silviterrae]TDX01350.1 3-oxoacyl-[acyl-carrier-protein] synthase-3 [Dinghuibacter silviterrae]